MDRIAFPLDEDIEVRAATHRAVSLCGTPQALDTLATKLSAALATAPRRVITEDEGPAQDFLLPAPASGGALQPGAVLDDDSPLWSMHSGRDRYDLPEWQPDDVDLALKAIDLFSDKARELQRYLVSRPGQLVDSLELAQVVEVDNAYGVAGVLNGFVRASEACNRMFPLRWFERPAGETALYGVTPRVAGIFAEAFRQWGAEPIRARSKRWHREVVPAAVELLAERARMRQPIPYGDLARTLRERVPGARVPHRGRVMGWLLADVVHAINNVSPNLPLLTSLVVTTDGRPSSGFEPLLLELRPGSDGDYRSEQERCVSEYSEPVVADLLQALRGPV